MPSKKELEKFIFETKPEKASAKLAINGFMIGSLFLILTLIWTLSPNRFGPIVIGQLMIAAPLLFVSSLAYAKLGYWRETRLWDTYGWLTNTIGNALIFNAIGLMTGTIYRGIAIAFFITLILLMLIYTLINTRYNPDQARQKAFKFIFFAAIILIGGIVPLL